MISLIHHGLPVRENRVRSWWNLPRRMVETLGKFRPTWDVFFFTYQLLLLIFCWFTIHDVSAWRFGTSWGTQTSALLPFSTSLPNKTHISIGLSQLSHRIIFGIYWCWLLQVPYVQHQKLCANWASSAARSDAQVNLPLGVRSGVIPGPRIQDLGP